MTCDDRSRARMSRTVRTQAVPAALLTVDDVIRYAKALQEQKMPGDALVKPVLLSADRLIGLEASESLHG